METPLVSIVIVNTNDEKFILPCLESLQMHESLLRKEILIVDNHSTVDLARILSDRFSDVRIIRLSENSGFCKANNAGILNATGDYILLLNPDTLFFQSSLSACLHYFQNYENENIGVVGCKLLNADGTLQKSFYRSAASIRKSVQANTLYIKCFGNRLRRKDEMIDQRLHSQTGSVPWLCGAFLLLRKSTLMDKELLLDEDFFLYSDDCELGHRLNRMRFKTIYYSDSSVIHLGGGSAPSLKKIEQLTISEWLCMMKVHGKAYFALNQLLLTLNWILDDFLFRKKAVFGSTTFTEKRNKIMRRKTGALLKKYSFKILFQFSRKPSSSSQMLRYAA